MANPTSEVQRLLREFSTGLLGGARGVPSVGEPAGASNTLRQRPRAVIVRSVVEGGGTRCRLTWRCS